MKKTFTLSSLLLSLSAIAHPGHEHGGFLETLSHPGPLHFAVLIATVLILYKLVSAKAK